MSDKKLTNQHVADELSRLTGNKRHWKTISRWRQLDVMPQIDGADLKALQQILGCTRDELLGSDD